MKHSNGELANQLWNYVSIYAYGLEVSESVTNSSFFEYHSYFKLIEKESRLTLFFTQWFTNSPGRRTSRRNRIWRKVYLFYSSLMIFLFKKNIVSSENSDNRVKYLPPTSPLPLQKKTGDTYFIGWLFRNPVGLKKFRKELIKAFAPNPEVERRVIEIIEPLRRNQYQKIIGLHIRGTDYKTFKGGTYYISQTRVKEIVDEYLQREFLDKNTTLFLITSDGVVEENIFRNINVYISKENSITDLFLLSSTDALIGSDSTFGAFASWYGNIPHIIMTKNPMDWTYYSNKKGYFENKYSKMMQY